MGEFLRRREGLYMFALGTDDLDGAVSEMRAKGVDVEEPVEGARQGGQGRPGYTWRSASLPPDATPGSETFLIEHDSTMEERYGEPPGLSEHRNGARSVACLEVAVEDAEAAASRWSRTLGLPQPSASEEDASVGGRRVSLALGNCRLAFVSPTGPGDAARFLEENGAAPYRLILESEDAASTERFLRDSAPGCADVDGGALVVRPGCAHGVSLRFV